MPTNDQDLRALTYLARRLRDETHGCAQWDEAGTFACLKEALAGQNLLIACQRILGHATDPKAHTPGAIKRPFVPEPTTDQHRERFDPRKVCAVCNQSEPVCREARDHEFRSVERARVWRGTPVPESIRAAYTATAAELCRHGVARDHCAEHATAPTRPTPAEPEESTHG